MAYFKDAHINSATINVFSWAKIQPSENEYNFTELDEIVDMLSKKTMTSSWQHPQRHCLHGWSRKYPETMSTDYEGRRHKFGARHNFCPNSLVYQKYAKALATELAKRYSGNKNISVWHINNEYGGYCYCDNCQKQFRVWLKDKVQDH